MIRMTAFLKYNHGKLLQLSIKIYVINSVTFCNFENISTFINKKAHVLVYGSGKY